VDGPTRAAIGNAEKLFGALLPEEDREATLEARLGDFAGLLSDAATTVKKKLPTAKGEAQIRALVGERGALTELVKDYQGELGVDRSGVVDLATFAAYKAARSKGAALSQNGTEQVTTEKKIQEASKLIAAAANGEPDPVKVETVMTQLDFLREAQKKYPRAEAGYLSGMNLVVKELCKTDPEHAVQLVPGRIAQFAKLAAPIGKEAVLHDLLFERIVKRFDAKRQAGLGMALVATKMPLEGLPVEVLDTLDSVLKEPWDLPRLTGYLGWHPVALAASVDFLAVEAGRNYLYREQIAAREALQRATVQKKEIQKVLAQDLGFTLDKVLAEGKRSQDPGQKVLANIAKLDANDPALRLLAQGLAVRYAGGNEGPVGVLRDLAGKKPNGGKVVSALVEEMYRSGSIQWALRDDFALYLLAPRSGSEAWHAELLAQLSKAARQKMAAELRGSPIGGWAVSDARKKLAQELDRLNALEK
jgi:hypothetical protein